MPQRTQMEGNTMLHTRPIVDGQARPGRFLRMALLMLLATGWLTNAGVLQAQDSAPLYGRLQAFRTNASYELRGYFGKDVGQPERFVLTAGMSAQEARRQMLSVPWDESYGLSDPQALAVWGHRQLHNFSETITLALDPSGGAVQSVVYDRQPALYSRAGLLRALRAQFHEGSVVVDESDRMVIRYDPLNGQALRAEADLLPGTQTHWRIVLRMDAPAAVEGPQRE